MTPTNAGLSPKPPAGLPSGDRIILGSKARRPSDDAKLEQLRAVLVGPEQSELTQLRNRVNELEQMEGRLIALEAIIMTTDERATAVAEVLVDAVTAPDREVGALGTALTPEIEHAVHASARDDSQVLAEALYPVMGPALRKMIADVFSSDSGDAGKSFKVQEILLIDRHAGLMLASSSLGTERRQDSDLVSGMLDAIASFVQDAFGQSDQDGLQDLRVGDTSVLVEWGPEAVLASVVTGLPTASYRHRAAETLEKIHVRYADELASFSGDSAPFRTTQPVLNSLASPWQPEAVNRPRTKRLLLAAVVVLAVVALALFAF